jgi:hypothetical protein
MFGPLWPAVKGVTRLGALNLALSDQLAREAGCPSSLGYSALEHQLGRELLHDGLRLGIAIHRPDLGNALNAGNDAAALLASTHHGILEALDAA